VLAELLAPVAHGYLGVDLSAKVITAARRRLEGRPAVRFEIGDMHDLPAAPGTFDTALLLHALTYTQRPAVVLAGAVAALRPGGRLLAVTLERHRHHKAVAPYNHANLGFTAAHLRKLASGAGLEVLNCARSTVERRTPHFAVLTLLGRRPA